jgi:hypothetical protein
MCTHPNVYSAVAKYPAPTSDKPPGVEEKREDHARKKGERNKGLKSAVQ